MSWITPISNSLSTMRQAPRVDEGEGTPGGNGYPSATCGCANRMGLAASANGNDGATSGAVSNPFANLAR